MGWLSLVVLAACAGGHEDRPAALDGVSTGPPDAHHSGDTGEEGTADSGVLADSQVLTDGTAQDVVNDAILQKDVVTNPMGQRCDTAQLGSCPNACPSLQSCSSGQWYCGRFSATGTGCPSGENLCRCTHPCTDDSQCEAPSYVCDPVFGMCR